MNKKTLWSIVILVVVAIVVYFGVVVWLNRNNAELKGTVSYRERIALPSGSEVKVQIRDVSKGETFAETSIITRGENVPIPFTVIYDASKIDPSADYDVVAQILVDGEERWTVGSPEPFIGEDSLPVEEIDFMLVASDRNLSIFDLDGKRLKMVSFNGKDAPLDPAYTLEFNNTLVSAVICNNIAGEFTLSDNTIKGLFVTTEKFCTSPDGIMEAEDAFKAMLSSGATLFLAGNTLTMSDSENIMVFSQ
ncbi:MAG TPA: YbaY family lipoprotein [Candidatus Colwellbacteria bacterium]|nr:YbaY family lipoprotein [Candidatus Colwellbacteria bacterium]